MVQESVLDRLTRIQGIVDRNEADPIAWLAVRDARDIEAGAALSAMLAVVRAAEKLLADCGNVNDRYIGGSNPEGSLGIAIEDLAASAAKARATLAELGKPT